MIVNEEQAALDNFERTFRDGSSGCVRDCDCGKVFYNPDTCWTWEDGELDRLNASGAKVLPYAVETVTFEGHHYVLDCDCWQVRALKLIAFLRHHDEQIAAFLRAEKVRKTAEADRSPVVT